MGMLGSLPSNRCRRRDARDGYGPFGIRSSGGSAIRRGMRCDYAKVEAGWRLVLAALRYSQGEAEARARGFDVVGPEWAAVRFADRAAAGATLSHAVHLGRDEGFQRVLAGGTAWPRVGAIDPYATAHTAPHHPSLCAALRGRSPG